MTCPHCRAINIETARFCEACGKSLPTETRDHLFDLHTTAPDFGNRPAPGQARTRLDLEPGHVFADRYHIAEEIGRGGMGVVYRAHDPVTERDVALKLIRGDRLAGKDAVKRLIREGVLARDIRHPNVVAVYDVGEVSGMPFLSMELLQGQSLRAWTQARMRAGDECSMATAANVVRELLSGLEAAHAQGVIHRDLKPENVIMLGNPSEPGARLKVLDFGIARAAGGSETGATSLGTLEYMSPEQITAPEAVQASADFYSLSVMFYELLIGVVPKGHWQPPSGGRGDVPVGVDKLIERGLSNNPRQRPQTAAQYRSELEAALGTAEPKPKPPPPKPQPGAAVTADKPAAGLFGIAGLTPVRATIGGAIAIAALAAIGLARDDTPEPVPVVSAISTPVPSPPTDQPATPPQSFVQPGQPAAPPLQAAENGPPDPSNYPMLSGYWIDDFQNLIQVSVNGSGQVAGSVSSGPLAGYQLQGQFIETLLNYAVANAYGQGAQSIGEWADACHIQYLLLDAFGQPTGQTSLIHVNHQPDDPCP